MTIKADLKNNPFGHCRSCSGQLRVGDSPLRVAAFRKLHPAIDKAMGGGAAPISQDVKQPVTVTEKKTGGFNLFDSKDS